MPMEPTKASHIQSKEAGMLGWVLLADLPGPSSGVQCSRALPIHSSFPLPYSPGHWACQTRAPPLFELTPVPSAPYAQCEVTMERLLGTPVPHFGGTDNKIRVLQTGGWTHAPLGPPVPSVSDMEGGMVPPACFNSSLCGTQSFPTMRNHATQRLASLAGTQGGAGAGGEGLGEEENGPEWYVELLSHLKVPSFSAFPYPCAPASSLVVSHSDHLLPPPPSHLGFCLPGAH